MRFSAHPERKSAFEKKVSSLNLIHGKCCPGHPWQNGIIERSHRTDNEELFHQINFKDAEMRRYQLKLWEFEYNNRRPHQSLGGQTPTQIYLANYRLHAVSRMLM
jgi:transposase InsO family protein